MSKALTLLVPLDLRLELLATLQLLHVGNDGRELLQLVAALTDQSANPVLKRIAKLSQSTSLWFICTA